MNQEAATQGKRPVRGNETLAKRVREALLALGGEAHRGMVIQQVAKALGHDVRAIPEDLSEALIQSFDKAWRDERKRAAYGFHLPFGEGSHRWAVLREPVYLH
jgi:CO/xanthine dehydrogenase FAD-binding subunit